MITMWVLTVKTSLPHVCKSDRDLKISDEAFVSFESAKQRLHQILKDLAFQRNAMFDGAGNLRYLDRYIEECRRCETEEEDLPAEDDSNWITGSFLHKIHNALREIFAGNSVVLSFPHRRYEDMFIRVDLSDAAMEMKGLLEGAMNGVNPRIKTNMFDMSEEKDYMLYIDDMLDRQEFSSELYIDLRKVTLLA